jgi:hypothetical protein
MHLICVYVFLSRIEFEELQHRPLAFAMNMISLPVNDEKQNRRHLPNAVHDAEGNEAIEFTGT